MIDKPIESYDEVWDYYDPMHVEAFLKARLQELTATKIGCWELVNGDDGNATLYGFASEEAKGEWAALREAGDEQGAAALVLSSVSFRTQSVSDEYTLLTRITSDTPAKLIRGEQYVVTFTYDSYYGGDISDKDTTPGFARVAVNGTQIDELGLTLAAGGSTHSIDIAPYLTAENNTVKLTVGNAHGKSRTWTFSVQVVEISLSLDESYVESVLRDGPWQLRVRCNGVPAKVTMAVDGKTVSSRTITNSTGDFTVDADGTLANGAHTITLVAENSDYGLSTEPLTARFIKGNSASKIPAICIGYKADSKVTLYDTASIPYFFFYPNSTTATVRCEVRDTEGNKLTDAGMQSVALTDFTSGAQEIKVVLADNEYLRLGKVVVAVMVGSIEATQEIEVLDAGVTIEAADECKVALLAAGKTNSDSDAEEWKTYYKQGNETLTTCTVVRSDNFRLNSTNGFVDGAYVIKAGKSITLEGVRPFATDFGVNNADATKRTGKTIEFEFETANVSESGTLIIDCMDGRRGFALYSDHAELGDGATVVETRYGENRRVHVGFCIDGSTTTCVNKVPGKDPETSQRNIAYIYVNGVIVRIMDYGNSSWLQGAAKDIVIAPEACDVKLYAVLAYDKSLKYRQMIDNYAYCTPLLADKIAIMRRNDVLDSNGAVDFAKTCAALPDTPYKVWTLTNGMPSGKKDYRKSDTVFVNPRWDKDRHGYAMMPFTCLQHGIALDGTSSLSYPDPYKNWANKYDGEWTTEIEGTLVTITGYSITPGAEDVEKEFVDKVNFASSEGISNILAMNAYQEILLGAAKTYPNLLTPMQQEQDSVAGGEVTFRQSLSGFPIIGWLNEGSGTSARKSFLSLFNFINNKYSASPYGYSTKGGDDAVEMWEVEDNVNFFMEHLPEGKWEDGKWQCRATELYYCRTPKSSKLWADSASKHDYGKAGNAEQVEQSNAEIKWLRRFHNWINACHPQVAERHRLKNGSYAVLGEDVKKYGHTHDTPEYRFAKFRAEYKGYMSKESALYYMNFCDFVLGNDSFDKNMSIMLVPATDADGNRIKIAYIILRDTDVTALYDNHGILAFKVFHEWNDTYNPSTGETGEITGESYDEGSDTYSIVSSVPGASPVYNGRLSGLWECVNKAWPTERRDMYAAMRAAGLNAADMLAMYDSFHEQWCEALYDVDAMGYANTGQFEMAYGDKNELYRLFYTQRQRYFDSKFAADTSTPLELRLNGQAAGVVLRYSVPIYASLNWGAGGIITRRLIKPGEPAYFDSPGTAFADTTFTIYHADCLTSVGTFIRNADGEIVEGPLSDISSDGVRVTSKIANCKLLRELVLDYSSLSGGNTNTGADIAGIGESIALEILVLRGLVSASTGLALKSERIREIDLRGSAFTALSVPPTAALTTVQLGEAVASLSLDGMPNLSTLTMESYGSLRELTLTDCPQIDSKAFIGKVLTAEGCSLSSFRLHGVAWATFPVAQLERLTDMKLASTENVSELTGTIEVQGSVSFALKQKLLRAWGNVDDAANALVVKYTAIELASVSVVGDTYMGKRGTYSLRVQPNTSAANNFVAVRWEMEKNAYATIDAASGVVTVTAVGAEEQSPSAVATVMVTKADGTVLTATRTVGFYERSCKVGDLVYADGSFSDVYDASKTVVGVCFYIDPANPARRLCVALNDLGSSSWGLFPNSNNWPDGFTLAKDPGYDCFDIPALKNKSNNVGYVNESTYLDNTQPDGYKVLTPAINGAVGELGFAQLTEDFMGYKSGEWLPYGLIDTLKIVAHRDYIISDSSLVTDDNISPQIPASSGENRLQTLKDTIAKYVAATASKYADMYYRPASYCNAYQPLLKAGSGEELAECFRAGKWYLPSVGDLARLYWLHKQGYEAQADGTVPPFANANANAGMARFSGNWYWSSAENYSQDAWNLNFSSGQVNNNTKYNGYLFRAVAAF